jgi:hypothetical protein
MAIEEQEIVNEDSRRRVRYTVSLSEELADGVITPDEYVRRRAVLVGQGDILQSLLLPLFMMIVETVRRVFRPRGR